MKITKQKISGKVTHQQKRFYTQEIADSHAVVKFEIVGPYTLHLIFDDGAQQTIDFEPVLHGGLWGPLRDLELFNQVYVDENGVLSWRDGQIDFNPATLYRWPENVEELTARVHRQVEVSKE